MSKDSDDQEHGEDAHKHAFDKKRKSDERVRTHSRLSRVDAIVSITLLFSTVC